jgi:hypothetical protein
MKLVVIFSLLLFIPIAFASPHIDSISDLTFRTIENDIAIEDPVKYRAIYSSTRSRTSVGNVESHIKERSDFVAGAILDLGYSMRPCKNLDLEIYDIPYSRLNDREKMTFIEEGLPEYMFGLYDSRHSEIGKASIFIAGDITPAVREETITHELVHYFHDILCLNVDTEDLAQKIEKMAQE